MTPQIVYENKTHWVAMVKTGYDVYKTGITHSVKVASIGYKDASGFSKAKIEADSRDKNERAKK